MNDLPLTTFCRQIAQELDIITANPPPDVEEFMNRPENLVLYPLSQEGYPTWREKSKYEIHAALQAKFVASPMRNPAVDGSGDSIRSMSFSTGTTHEPV